MTVCPAKGEGAMLCSLLIVEACSETDREIGELVSEVVDPKQSTIQSNQLLDKMCDLCCPFSCL